jgi:Protein of unknown function (DUF3300)
LQSSFFAALQYDRNCTISAFEEVFMRAKNNIRRVLGLFIITMLAIFLASPLQTIQAQDSVVQESVEKFSREELAQMLAPIALYPDVVLSQVLMASTYPIEVIEADRWIKKNSDLKGNSLDNGLEDKDWDPSVKALCHFPSILALMSLRISETTTIGNAFLAQEDEVMETIQELRAKAKAEGNLNSTDKQKIVVEKETIIIEPADPEVIYVPYYDPLSIYGPWWYPAYPPYYWGPARASIGVGFSYWPAFYFGFAFGSWSYFDWPRHYIYIDAHRRPRYVRNDRWRKEPGRWQHLPVHRKGVAYRDKFTAQKYGQYRYRSRDFRPEARGFPERRDMNRYQRLNDRSRYDQERQGDIRRQVERERQGQQTIVPARPAGQANNATNQQNRVITPPAEVERQSIERGRIQQRTLRESREPARIIPESQRQPITNSPQIGTGADQQRRTRERIESQRQLRSSDTIFNRLEDGSKERESSTRGQYSRQRWNTRNEGSRSRSQNEGFNDRSRTRNESRDDRNRNRR